MDNTSKQADIAEWAKPSSDPTRKADFALKLFKKDYPIEEIAEITGFSMRSTLRIKELLEKS
ncbi:MAG: hypothetical protein LBC41_05545 [Clostridiales bacterium]|jgi:hypothetical protein|nr:hypothetical protein [Clostridiales bacterium]MDR2750104.1 hypothetical protein [Clostridiales bacterium]